MSDDLAPFSRELLRHNRAVMADRLGWPKGAVEACNLIEEAFPDWNPGWDAEWTAVKGWDRPAGYYARRHRARHGEPAAYGATAEELIAAIKTWPTWKWDWSVPCPPGEKRAV